MRLNRYIAKYTGLSRRKADDLIEQGKVVVNRSTAHVGMEVSHKDSLIVDGKKLVPVKRTTHTVLLHKPVGFVCSKDGQGAPTVYDLLPRGMHRLNIAGRLDKDSSGLVVLTDDGQLLQDLTHPSNNKEKIYEVELNKILTAQAIKKLQSGVDIGDGRLSKLNVVARKDHYRVRLTEGRNRQIRRSFEALGYHVTQLHRTHVGAYTINTLAPEEFQEV